VLFRVSFSHRLELAFILGFFVFWDSKTDRNQEISRLLIDTALRVGLNKPFYEVLGGLEEQKKVGKRE